MSVRTIESSTIKLQQINAPDNTPSILISDVGVVSLPVQPTSGAGDAIATQTYVQNEIANATGGISLNTSGSYEWTGSYQVFNNDMNISIGNNLNVPPTIPLGTCNANQTGLQIDNNEYGLNETDFINYSGNQSGGFNFSTISSTTPLKQCAKITNTGTKTVMNLIGAGSEYQLNGTSITVSNPVSETGDNDFTATNTFAGTTDFNGPTNINDISSVTDVMSFDPNCLQLVNDAIPSNVGSIFVGSGGNLNLQINQSTAAVGILCGNYGVALKADSSGLNIANSGLTSTATISANNLTATSAITGNTLTLTGTSSVPTAPVGTNTNQIASTAFVLANAGGGGGGGLDPNVPNTFTATQTFQGNSTYPTQLSLTKGSGVSSISYDGLNMKFVNDNAGTFVFSDNVGNSSYIYPSGGDNLAIGTVGNIITQTSLNSALIPYLQTSTASQTYANLSGAVFSGNVGCNNLAATTGSVAGSAILTQASITPYLSNYAQISGQVFSGTISAPTIRSTGAISALSGTINGFPIVTKNNLDNALTGYAALTGATFTGNVNVPNVPINDKYPTTLAVTSDSVINYVNAKLVSANYFVGQIISGAFPPTYAPLINSGWLYCNGDVYDRFGYSDLFDVLGFNYPNSNPSNNTFAIPNFVGKTQLGGNGNYNDVPTFSDNSTNETYAYFYGGSIGITEAPQHNHTIYDGGHSHQYGSNFVNVNQGSGSNQFSALLNTPSVFANTTQPQYTGISVYNNNTIPTVGTLPPYCAVNFFIYAGPNTP
jgi:hypothetical protein